MKRKPTSLAEKELRERFENAEKEAINPQHYRQLRREIKREMKQLDRKINKKETEKALKEYISNEED